MDLFTLHSNPETLHLYKESQGHDFAQMLDLIKEIKQVAHPLGDNSQGRNYHKIRKHFQEFAKYKNKKKLVEFLKHEIFVAVNKNDWWDEEIIVCDFVKYVLQARWPEMEKLMIKVGADGWDEYVEILEELGVEPPPEPDW